jgi:hypothetical protein
MVNASSFTTCSLTLHNHKSVLALPSTCLWNYENKRKYCTLTTARKWHGCWDSMSNKCPKNIFSQHKVSLWATLASHTCSIGSTSCCAGGWIDTKSKDKLTHEYIIRHQTRRMNIKLSASCWCGMSDFWRDVTAHYNEIIIVYQGLWQLIKND